MTVWKRTTKIGFLIVQWLGFSSLAGQSTFQMISMEPVLGQWTDVGIKIIYDGFVSCHLIQNSVTLSDGTILNNLGRQDIVLLQKDSHGMLKWALHIANGDEANVTGLEVDSDRETLWICGTFWEYLMVADSTLPLEFGQRGIFVLCFDLISGELIFAEILQGEGMRFSGGICLDDNRWVMNGVFSQRLVWKDRIIESVGARSMFSFSGDFSGGSTLDLLGSGSEMRLVACMFQSQNLLHAGVFSGEIAIGSDWQDTGRISDSEVFLFSNTLDSKFLWYQSGKGVLDNILTDAELLQPETIVISGHLAGNMVFRNGLTLRSQGSTSNAFAVLIGSDGNPLGGRVWTGDGTFLSINAVGLSDLILLSGTYDRRIAVGSDSIVSPAGSRSGAVLIWDISRDALEAWNISVQGQTSSVWIDCLDESCYLMVNFSGIMQWQEAIGLTSAGFTSAVWKVVGLKTGIEVIPPATKSTAIPNPFGKLLQVKCACTAWHIYHAQGKLMAYGVEDYLLNTDHWPPGLYFLVTAHDNLMVRTQKILKMQH